MKSKYTIDLFDEKDIINSQSVFKKEENAYITETAGFVPLEVKLKQFEQNGLVAQFQVKDFDSSDYRDMYLNPDFSITPEDEIEDVEEKLEMQHKFILDLKKQKTEEQKKAVYGLSAAKAGENKTNEEVKVKEETSQKE